MELTTYVLYDIEDDRIRTKIAEACLDYGLTRLQFSVFSGPMSRNRREEIFARLTDLLGKETGKVLVQPVCEADLAARRAREVKNEKVREKEADRPARSAAEGTPASDAH